MQAALQPFVDSAISKTINVPHNCSFAEFADLYRQAHALGLKGCTTFRTGCRSATVQREVPMMNLSSRDCSRCDTE
jgi:ribonucleoside-diphosphate reductase alpha chain